MFICVMGHVLLKKREALNSQECIYPSQLWGYSSVNWFFSCTAINNSFQLMYLSPQRHKISWTSIKWMPSSFFTCQHCAFLHFGYSTEKCIMTPYKKLRIILSFRLCFGVHLGFFEICHLSSFYSAVQKLPNFFITFLFFLFF